MKYFLPILVLFVISSGVFISSTYARTTPEDIINAKKATYDQKISRYSTVHQQNLTNLSSQIAQVNKLATDAMSAHMETQGDILDEYLRRHDFKSNDAIENARYWVTYAHEAVAYQAAKIYVFDLTSESNIRNDATNTIRNLDSDLNILNNKVEKSQKIVQTLVTKP